MIKYEKTNLWYFIMPQMVSSFWVSISILSIKQDNYIHFRGLFLKLNMTCNKTVLWIIKYSINIQDY